MFVTAQYLSSWKTTKDGIWDVSVGMVTRLHGVEPNYFCSHIVTDNISLYSKAGKPCMWPICLILAVVTVNVWIMYINYWKINITTKYKGEVLQGKFMNDCCKKVGC
jgi:hypothetical protein